MKKSGLNVYQVGSAMYVITHAEYQKSRGRRPSLHYKDILNPAKALKKAFEVMGHGHYLLDGRAYYIPDPMVALKNKFFITEDDADMYAVTGIMEDVCPMALEYEFMFHHSHPEDVKGLKEAGAAVAFRV